MPKLCKTCGEPNCTKHEFKIGKAVSIKNFSGSSPPEIFVGKWNYPNVYTGILSPTEYGNTEILSSPELWHKNRLQIAEILKYRNQLVYGRTQSNIKKLQTKFLSVMKEVAMTHKSVASSFKLKKPITKNKEQDSKTPLIPKAADVESVKLEENAPVKSKVDYLVNDAEVKSQIAIQELASSNISTSSIIKILSAGLLGLKKNRRLVPTRWAITATDDALSKAKLEKIKQFREINDCLVFNDEYVGNHYEILLIPRYWSFEVIEMRTNYEQTQVAWQDYESIFKRKKYASDVTGAYYANRLGVAEYLEKIKRQASALVLREIKPSYYAPLGVGILRETTRSAMGKEPKKFNALNEALADIQSRLSIPIEKYLQKSELIKSLKQTALAQFLK